MGMINLGSSMRYGPSGKKRKTNAWKTKKNTIIAHTQGKFKPSLQEQQRLQQMKEHNETRGGPQERFLPRRVDLFIGGGGRTLGLHRQNTIALNSNFEGKNASNMGK